MAADIESWWAGEIFSSEDAYYFVSQKLFDFCKDKKNCFGSLFAGKFVLELPKSGK